MKIRVTMKTPDAVDDAISRAIEDHPEGVVVSVKGKPVAGTPQMSFVGSIDEDSRESLEAAIKKLSEKWFRYGETVTLEIDTEQGTCVVMPC
jgi:hypothetical protein